MVKIESRRICRDVMRKGGRKGIFTEEKFEGATDLNRLNQAFRPWWCPHDMKTSNALNALYQGIRGGSVLGGWEW